MDINALWAVLIFAAIALPCMAMGRMRDRLLQRAAAQDRRTRDMDETRRLLYMILAAGAASQHGEAVATTANALAHHGHGIPVDESLPRLTSVVNGDDAGDAQQWIKMRISEITDRLDDQPS